MPRKPTTAPWTRRDFIKTVGLAGGAAMAGWPVGARAQGPKAISASHSISTFVYGQHLVAAQKKFFEAEGLLTPDFIVPGGGAKVVQALAAGQVLFALGDSNHPLKITEKGKDALMIFATDRRCSYANIVVRKELFDKGVKSVEALADQKLVGRKAVIAATAIGSGTYVYGVYVLKHTKPADGKPVNDAVEWVGGGGDLTMLAGLKGGKFDAIMAVPEWQSKAVAQGFGQPIYDVQDEKA
ncbi:MAG TPA: ABC transporter substrate-binding protein, partial [Terriglobales bacterium]|nr:ABC transporter substrate-binding protein [Terriglobales bacterium]